MDQETYNRQNSASFDYLAGHLIADIITARILGEPDNEFNIDAYWSDLREEVLYQCQERMRSIKFTKDDEVHGW